jgi:hypothetical protein
MADLAGLHNRIADVRVNACFGPLLTHDWPPLTLAPLRTIQTRRLRHGKRVRRKMQAVTPAFSAQHRMVIGRCFIIQKMLERFQSR